ncbi:DUF1194 domain-containing protein [Cribrihabitans neustonicus]|uniref:DUF1194 domain-containing protein n=1 Tax=Cribrihabitans neustonicus TaxID=1429085 RepID=UPI003B5C6BF8
MRVLRHLFLSLIFLAPFKAAACDLALVLAVDVSGSVDSGEYRAQMDGLAAALRDGIVAESLVRGRAQVMLLQWSGSARQEVTLPWTEVQSFAGLEALAQRIEEAPRPWRNYSTAVGEALALGLAQFGAVPGCRRRVIDISGDGPSNEGAEPRTLQPALRAANVTVNAIAIEQSEPDLTAYFYENVILGEGAFVVTAASFADYPEGIRKKLLREVARQTAALPAAAGSLR